MKNLASQKLAQRYADALFAVASEASVLPSVEADLKALAEAAEQSADFAGFLYNPLLTRSQSAEVVGAVLKGCGAHELTQKFMYLLAQQKRLPALPVIAQCFAKMTMSARGEMAADLISASELKQKDVDSIADKLTKAYGKKITTETSIDPELLGGVIVRIGSAQLDSSVSGKLQRLKNTLSAA